MDAQQPTDESLAGTPSATRRRVGLTLGPLLFLTVLVWPIEGLPPAAQRVGAVLVLMAVLWITEALPLAVTALIGPALVVMLGASTVQTAVAGFADPVVFLFIGGFFLAEAMTVHGLDRRIAFTALASPWVGSSGVRLIVTFASVACALSMWMSNVATTAMLFPLGMAILAELGRERRHDPAFRRYAMAMMLSASFGASIGGMGTPVGTPPNLIGTGLLRSTAGIDVSFAGWMIVGMPILLLMIGFLIATLLVPAGRHIVLGQAAVAAVAHERDRLGPMNRGERNVVIAFSLTIGMWIIPGLAELVLGGQHAWVVWTKARMPESMAALVGGLLLFLLPLERARNRATLTWKEATRIDWGIVFLYGGGLAMGRLVESTGLSAALGRAVIAQFPDAGAIGLTLVFTLVALVMSETASNTASANIVVPMAVAVSQAAGISPLEPVLGATLGASLGFMLPISTPPNAVVYASGHIPLSAMMKHGVTLDVAGYFIVVAVVLLLGRFVG